jgi:hypothetical protein
MAGPKKKLIIVDPLLKVTTPRGFIQGVRVPSLPPWLRPPELKKKEKKPYLEADSSKEIRRPPSILRMTPHHGSRPGNLLPLLPRLHPAPRLCLLRTASPQVRALVWPKDRKMTLKGNSGGEPSRERERRG